MNKELLRKKYKLIRESILEKDKKDEIISLYVTDDFEIKKNDYKI